MNLHCLIEIFVVYCSLQLLSPNDVQLQPDSCFHTLAKALSSLLYSADAFFHTTTQLFHRTQHTRFHTFFSMHIGINANTRHNMVLHRYRMHWLHADDSHCDDFHCLVIPSLIPIPKVGFGARTRFPTTLRTRSPLPLTHNSLCTPIRAFTGGLSRRFRLRSPSHADRMRKLHAA